MKLKTNYLLLIIVVLLGIAGNLTAGEPFEIRGWDIENFQPDYVYEMIDKAASMNANTIGFSHEICMNVEEIIYDWHRYQHLRRFCDYAHKKGMRVFLWTHEVNGDLGPWILPPLKGETKPRLNMDDPALFEYIAGKYRQAIDKVPNCDGFILSLTESRFQVHRVNESGGALIQAERMAKVINAVYKGCNDRGKILMVRDFLRSPGEMESFLDAMKMVPDDVWVYSKCVPNDWEFSYPPNPMLGKVAPHKQVMEMDLSVETGGINEMSMCIVDYIQEHLRNARDKGLAGAISRCDDGFGINKGTANEINVWSYGHLLNDPDMNTDWLWAEWCKKRYGEKGGPVAEYVLRKTFPVVNKVSYTLGFWTGQYAPSIEYADGHLVRNSNALWDPSPKNKRIEAGLLHPNQTWIDTTIAEKKEAQEISQHCIDYLDRYGAVLEGEDYQTLRENFERCIEQATVGEHWVRIYYTLREYRDKKNNKVLKKLEQALSQCDRFIDDAPNRKWPRVDRLKSFIEEVRREIKK